MTTDRTEPRHAPTHTTELSWITEPERGPIDRKLGVGYMHAAVAERPDWNPTAVMAAMDELRHMEPVNLRKALFRLVETPGSTPDQLNTTGPHWEDPKPAPVPVASVTPIREVTRPESNDTSPMCKRHPTIHEWECGECKPRGNGRPDWFFDRVAQAKAEADKRRAEERARLEAAQAADEERNAKLGIGSLSEHLGRIGR